jgi:excisionase family DNA binding protein
MSEDLGRTLIDELARALPRVLDDEALEELAARLRPHLANPVSTTSGGEKLLTTAEAAERAHVHVETVRRAIRGGHLAVAARIGQSPRLTTLAIDSWLAETSQTDRAARTIRSRRSRHSEQPHEYLLAAAFKTST